MADEAEELNVELAGGEDPGPDDDEGAVDVELTEEEAELPFTYNEDDGNLVDSFLSHRDGVIALERISRQVIQDWDAGLESRKEYVERMSKDWRIFACELPKKDWPHEYASNAHVPTMLENISRLSFRLYGEIFDDVNNVFNVVSLGPQDSEIADILTRHSNWQLRVEIKDFYRQMHRAVLAFFIHGDITGHSFYDEVNKVNAHELLMPDEFVVPFSYTSTMPDYSDCPWRAKVITKYPQDLERLRGSWAQIDKVLRADDPSWSDDPERLLTEIANEVMGIEPDEVDNAAPYKLIWYEGWMKLPNQAQLRFCQAIVDYSTKTIVKLSIHERVKWQDRIRFERQVTEAEQYHQAVAAHQQMTQAHQQMLQHGMQQAILADQQGALSPGMQDNAIQALQAQAMAPLPPPPVPPDWMSSHDGFSVDELGNRTPEQPRPPEKEPIHLFSHGVCIEPLSGNLGIGYGRAQADYNRGANIAFAQFIDAATLGNVKAWIAAGDVSFDGKLRIEPGRVNRVKGISAESLKSALIPIETTPANPQMLEIVDRMSQYAQSSMQAPSVLSGDPGKSGETFRGISARIEQATKQLSVVGYKFLSWLQTVLGNNAYLNSVFLPEDELYEVANVYQSGMEAVRVRREMYARSYAVEFRADMRFASQAQKIQEADEVYMMVMKDPVTGPSQTGPGNMALHYYVLKKCFEARGRRDLVQLLGAPPPPQQTFAPPSPGMGPPGGPPGAPPQGPPGPPGPQQ